MTTTFSWDGCVAEPLYVTIKEAGRLTSLSRSTLYSLMDSGHVAWIKVGKRRLVVMSSLRDIGTGPYRNCAHD